MTGFRVADRVGVVADDKQIYVAHLPDGPILGLDGTAALIWEAALSGPNPRIVDRVAAAVGVPADDIADDVSAFVTALVEQGLIVRRIGAGY